MVSGNGKEGLVPSSYIQPLSEDGDIDKQLEEVDIRQIAEAAESSTSSSTLDKAQRAVRILTLPYSIALP